MKAEGANENGFTPFYTTPECACVRVGVANKTLNNLFPILAHAVAPLLHLCCTSVTPLLHLR
jgi:hypothetical protein